MSNKDLTLGKIEAKSTDRLFRIQKFSTIALFAVAIINTVFIYKIKITGLGQFIDSALMILIGILLLLVIKKSDFKDRQGQYILWDSEKITVRIKGFKTPVIIDYNDINSIDIKIETISLY